ncbi:MAG: sugar phosphate isomerase/epimerase family protein [Bacteroidota bacterium]
MSDIKFSIREGMVPGRNVMERFELLAKVGIAGCEVTGTISWDTLDDVKAAVAATGIVPNIWSSSNLAVIQADPGARAAAIAACIDAIKMSGEVGAIGFILPPTIMCKMQNLTRIPDLSPLMGTAELERKLNAEIIKQQLAPVCKEAGAQVVIEPLNRYEQWWPCTIQHGIDIVNDCGGPGNGVCIMADFFHMNIEDASYYDSIKAGGAMIRNVHLADSQRQLPGWGHTDFHPGFRALKEIGYSDYLGFECGVGGDWEDSIRKSMDYCRKVWDEA